MRRKPMPCSIGCWPMSSWPIPLTDKRAEADIPTIRHAPENIQSTNSSMQKTIRTVRHPWRVSADWNGLADSNSCYFGEEECLSFPYSITPPDSYPFLSRRVVIWPCDATGLVGSPTVSLLNWRSFSTRLPEISHGNSCYFFADISLTPLFEGQHRQTTDPVLRSSRRWIDRSLRDASPTVRWSGRDTERMVTRDCRLERHPAKYSAFLEKTERLEASRRVGTVSGRDPVRLPYMAEPGEDCVR